MGRAYTPRDTAVQFCVDDAGFQLPDYKLEGSTWSFVQLQGIFLEALPDVACVPVYFDRQRSVVIDISFKTHTIVRLFVLLAGCLDPECCSSIRHLLRAHIQNCRLRLLGG